MATHVDNIDSTSPFLLLLTVVGGVLTTVESPVLWMQLLQGFFWGATGLLAFGNFLLNYDKYIARVKEIFKDFLILIKLKKS